MSTLKKIGRALIILIAVLVIVLSAAGIYGAWYVNRTVTDITLKVFSVVDIGVAVAETGVYLLWVGALTHSASVLDLGLDFKASKPTVKRASSA